MTLHEETGQVAPAALVIVLIVVVIAGGIVDVYRLQETRSWAYRTAEICALVGATEGRDLGSVYTTGLVRVDPVIGRASAEAAIASAMALRGIADYVSEVRVCEWGGETITGFPPVARGDMWGSADWFCAEPGVGVYLALPVETFLLGLVTGNEPVTVHAFAAAGVSSP